MSLEAKLAVLEVIGELPVEPSDRFILLLIADRQSDTKGYSWCSAADLAYRSGYSIGHVRRCIGRLEAAELLMVGRQQGSVHHMAVIHNPAHHARGTGAMDPAHHARTPAHHARRNQLENQLENLAPTALNFPADNNTKCGHRWVAADGSCPVCLTQEAQQ